MDSSQGRQKAGDDGASNRFANPILFCPQDPSRMEISDLERQRALQIKSAVEFTPGLEPLTDYEYVQLAIVDQDNIESAVERVQHFQTFREECGLSGTCEEFIHLIVQSVHLLPHFILSLSVHENCKCFVLILDLEKFKDSAIKRPEEERCLLGGAYALLHAISPDFHSIRNGIYAIIECEGYDWNHFSRSNIQMRLWEETAAFYPINFRQIKFFHTGLFANLAVSRMRKFLQHDAHSKIQMGCQFPPGRLDLAYARPSKQFAQEMFLARMTQCLKTRFNHRKCFRLKTESPQGMPTATPATD